MGRRFGWVLLLAAVLVWTGACTASRPPTPTAQPTAPATATPTPTPQTTQAGPAVEITATQTEPDQAAEGTATPAPDQAAEDTATPTEQQPQDQAAGEASEQTEQDQAALEQVRAIQQIFEELKQKWPEGYTKGFYDSASLAQGGEGGFAYAVWNLFSSVDRPLTGNELSLEMERFLSQDPNNHRLVLYFSVKNAVYCPKAYDMTACRFSPGEGEFFIVYKWRGKPVPELVIPLNQTGIDLVKQGRQWAAMVLAGGLLPTDRSMQYQREASWRIFVFGLDQETRDLYSFGGMQGRTKIDEINRSKGPHISGYIGILDPEGAPDMQEIQSAIIEHVFAQKEDEKKQN